MHKPIKMMLLSLPLMVALAACTGSKSTTKTAEAPNEAMKDAQDKTGQAMKGAGDAAAGAEKKMMEGGAQTDTSNSSKQAKDDASSAMRRAQLNNDVRAREQRADSTGNVSDGDLESKVRSKLEANLQKRTLTVNAKAGVVTIRGKVADQTEVDKVVRLTHEINGVKDVRSELTTGAS